MKISVIIKEPGKKPRHVHIENSLKNLQKTVGGYIETVSFAEDVTIICNEEGRLLGLPYCCTVLGCEFVGTIILAGVNGEELCDIPQNYAFWKKHLASMWAD